MRWGEVLCKLIVSFYVLVTRKNKVLLESSKLNETHLGVVVEFLKVHISVFFELCLDEEFI